MSFKKFLIEKHSSRHELTYQKLLIALDDAHVSKGEGFFEFNLGSVVDDSSLSRLTVRIQKGDQVDVKMGNFRDGAGKVLVVFTEQLPSRKEIDTLLSTNKSVMRKFIKALNDYTASNGGAADETKSTKREKLASQNMDENFEDNYQELIDSIEAKKKEYDMVMLELDKEENETVNKLKKASIQAAKNKLKKEFFGTSENEFIKTAMKLPEAEFMKSLDKELQDKVKSRLENYYQQKF